MKLLDFPWILSRTLERRRYRKVTGEIARRAEDIVWIDSMYVWRRAHEFINAMVTIVEANNRKTPIGEILSFQKVQDLFYDDTGNEGLEMSGYLSSRIINLLRTRNISFWLQFIEFLSIHGASQSTESEKPSILYRIPREHILRSILDRIDSSSSQEVLWYVREIISMRKISLENTDAIGVYFSRFALPLHRDFSREDAYEFLSLLWNLYRRSGKWSHQSMAESYFARAETHRTL